jgi:tRNA pseudouridine32 synthase/23S rRNA pseudouridine746 synthase
MIAGLPEILFVDDRLIVLNKPSGLLSVPGIGPEKLDCLATRVQQQHPEARIVHRLDRDTSGVIVMARDGEAHRQLSMQFQDRQVSKIYLAVVAGRPAADRGVIDLPIRKDLDDPPRQIVDHARGRPSITNWRLIQRQADRSRLELEPLTGRSHQLRLHLKAIGHPVLGDDLYAPPEVVAMTDRLMLHATSLTLIHPTTARLMSFEAPCPF